MRLVRLLATVKDEHGKPAADLKHDDFTVYDNGVKQEVSVFERYTEQPLSVALLVDISGSTAKDLKYEADSVSRFLKALFREGNALGLLRTVQLQLGGPAAHFVHAQHAATRA